MTDTLATLFGRSDTFFGVCQAIGDDFGFNPDWLRMVLALPVIFNPWMSLVAYGVLAIAVVASRMLVPARSHRLALTRLVTTAVQGEPANDSDQLQLAA